MRPKAPLLFLPVVALLLLLPACTPAAPTATESALNHSDDSPVTPAAALETAAPAPTPPDVPYEQTGIDPTLPLFDASDGYNTVLVQPIVIGEAHIGEFTSIFDAHNWVYTGQAGETITIHTFGINGTDTRIKLIDPAGNVLNEVDDVDGSYDPLLIATLAMDGAYTIRVDTFNAGAYTITVD